MTRDAPNCSAGSGAHHAIVDNGNIASGVRDVAPGGVDAALELVGLGALPDTLAAVRRGGVGCFTGALDGQWTLKDFSPFALIPIGVRLTTYGGTAADLPADVFARQLTSIKNGDLSVPIGGQHHGLEQVAKAHAALEAGKTPGKQVVILD